MYQALSSDDWECSIRTLLRNDKETTRNLTQEVFFISTIAGMSKKAGSQAADYILPVENKLDSLISHESPQWKQPVIDIELTSENIEGNMSAIAHELKETATRMHQTLLLDTRFMHAVSRTQEENLSRTTGHKTTAVALRSSGRFGLFSSVLMVLTSISVFIILIPIIWLS